MSLTCNILRRWSPCRTNGSCDNSMNLWALCKVNSAIYMYIFLLWPIDCDLLGQFLNCEIKMKVYISNFLQKNQNYFIYSIYILRRRKEINVLYFMDQRKWRKEEAFQPAVLNLFEIRLYCVVPRLLPFLSFLIW